MHFSSNLSAARAQQRALSITLSTARSQQHLLSRNPDKGRSNDCALVRHVLVQRNRGPATTQHQYIHGTPIYSCRTNEPGQYAPLTSVGAELPHPQHPIFSPRRQQHAAACLSIAVAFKRPLGKCDGVDAALLLGVVGLHRCGGRSINIERRLRGGFTATSDCAYMSFTRNA